LDDGETESRICQSINDAFKREFNKRDIEGIAVNLAPHPVHANVHVYEHFSNALNLRLAVHIAAYRWSENFKNCTIDDYLLKLALRPTVLAKLSSKLGITPEKLSAKSRMSFQTYSEVMD
ncbi:hypothetical protein HC928_11515, partial [bacterium]|nr:hypothetical protein [bacterium]